MLHTDFLNKNTFRNYPLRADASCVGDDGVLLPTSLLVAARFTLEVGWEHVWIGRIYVNGNYVNALVVSDDGGGPEYVGYFDGVITGDYQTLQLSPLLPQANGSLTFGRLDALAAYQGFHTFTPETGRFEDSTLTCINPPPVSSITVGASRLTGRISFEYNNVRKLADPSILRLEVINKESVKASGDTSARFGSCRTNPIGSMNGVLPDENGNIDIIGIAPLKVDIVEGGVALRLPDIPRSEICAEEKRIPPLIETSTYLQNIRTATEPEWKTWPQYVTP